MFNPYAQGGWSNPQNSYSINNGSWENHLPPQMSPYGALPSSVLPSQPKIITLLITPLDPITGILNCRVIGPNNQTYFVVSTPPNIGAPTVFYNHQGRNVATVEWHEQPLVEVQDAVPRQTTSRWIGVAPNQKCRTMEVKGKLYAWVSNSAGMNLNSVGPCQPELIAKATHELNTVQLQITAQAVQEGLLESTVVATVLLYCGHNVS